jgi:dihydroorotase
LPLPRAIATITQAPAAIIGVAAGTLRPGAVADLCIVDASQAWTVQRDALYSQGKNTPFLGIELVGRIRQTLLEGQVVYERGTRPST